MHPASNVAACTWRVDEVRSMFFHAHRYLTEIRGCTSEPEQPWANTLRADQWRQRRNAAAQRTGVGPEPKARGGDELACPEQDAASTPAASTPEASPRELPLRLAHTANPEPAAEAHAEAKGESPPSLSEAPAAKGDSPPKGASSSAKLKNMSMRKRPGMG